MRDNIDDSYTAKLPFTFTIIYTFTYISVEDIQLPVHWCRDALATEGFFAFIFYIYISHTYVGGGGFFP